jgi:hypothetical protein
MPVIDPSGLYFGDRLRKLSQKALLYWPFFYCLSNGYGRFEVTYSFILSKFKEMPSVPSQGEVKEMVAEYARAHLLYLYRSSDGTMWGQWDTQAKYLPYHKSTADKLSPAPPEQEFSEWVQQYRLIKRQESGGDLGDDLLVLGKSNNGFSGFGKFSSGIGIGIGIGLGVGIGVGSSLGVNPEREYESGVETFARNGVSGESQHAANGSNSKPTETLALTAPEPETAEQKAVRKKRFLDESFDAFYRGYWRKVGRKRAREAWPKAIVAVMQAQKCSAQAAAEFLIGRMQAQTREIEARSDLEWLLNMHPTSWLNGARWDDDLGSPRARAAAMGAAANSMAAAREALTGVTTLDDD